MNQVDFAIYNVDEETTNILNCGLDPYFWNESYIFYFRSHKAGTSPNCPPFSAPITIALTKKRKAAALEEDATPVKNGHKWPS
jgi:hypothetical protein